MISTRSDSNSSSNFIYKNIQHFSTDRSTSTHKAVNFCVDGISVPLNIKESVKSITKTNTLERKVTADSPERLKINVPKKAQKAKVAKPVAKARKVPVIPLGVRRASIRAKCDRQAGENLGKRREYNKASRSDNEGFAATTELSSHRGRKSLVLPISWIPVPESPPVGVIEVLLKFIAHKLKGRGNQEALNRRVEVLERILASMDLTENSPQYKASHRNVDVHLANLTLNSEKDRSYEEIYQSHVEELNTLISNPETGSTEVSSPDSAEVKKAKKKTLPKLEIKIAPTEKLGFTEGEDIEAPAEESETRGDLTPVITYNHVSSVNINSVCLYGVAISPGSSSKGSRSPSPLLEVPPTPGEICTKFPTAPCGQLEVSPSAPIN